jgi:hypothetical protein
MIGRWGIREEYQTGHAGFDYQGIARIKAQENPFAPSANMLHNTVF